MFPSIHNRTVVLVLICSALVTWSCREKAESKDSVAVKAQSPRRTGTPSAPQKLAPPSIHLRIYPDMAVPGKEVVVEASLVPDVVTETPEYIFKIIEDPCDGELELDGKRAAIYKVPSDCRGSAITMEVVVIGSFGRLNKTLAVDIKKTSFMDSVVFTYPVPGQNAQSPIAVWWDRTLYENREERLSFKVKRFEQFILDTGTLDPQQVVELDIPPSPEEVVLFGETTTGSQETALIRVYKRVVPEWPANVLMVDRFTLPDANSMDAPRKRLDDGGEVELGTAYRISEDGREPYLYMHYHVSKAKRYGRNEALMGFSEEVPVRATRAGYKEVEVWLRGDSVRGAASPVYVRLEGSGGSSRTYKIKRLKDNWRPYYFPLYRALRSSDERLKTISIFVDAKDVTPPLGTILFGGLYLRPHPGGTADE